MTNKPIADFSVEEVAALVTRLVDTSRYEATITDAGLNGAALWEVAGWEELRDDFGIATAAHARLVMKHVQSAKAGHP